jgi:DNA-binding transcriptional LysR family regulator
MFDAIVATCMRHGFSPRLFPARQMQTIVSLVSGGMGVALVPSSVQALGRAGVAYRPMKGEKAFVDTVAVWRRSDDSPLVRAMLGMVPRAGARPVARRPDLGIPSIAARQQPRGAEG